MLPINEFIGLLFLTAPITFFAVKYYLDFWAYGARPSKLQYLAMILFCAYFATYVWLGHEEFRHLMMATGTRSASRAFALPGLGFAAAAFPYQASELSENYVKISSLQLNKVFAFFGWLGLLYCALMWLALSFPS